MIHIPTETATIVRILEIMDSMGMGFITHKKITRAISALIAMILDPRT